MPLNGAVPALVVTFVILCDIELTFSCLNLESKFDEMSHSNLYFVTYEPPASAFSSYATSKLEPVLSANVTALDNPGVVIGARLSGMEFK